MTHLGQLRAHRRPARAGAGASRAGIRSVLESIDDGEILGVSVQWCELRAGAELARRPMKSMNGFDRLLSGLMVRYPDERFADAYGRLLAAYIAAARR